MLSRYLYFWMWVLIGFFSHSIFQYCIYRVVSYGVYLEGMYSINVVYRQRECTFSLKL